LKVDLLTDSKVIRWSLQCVGLTEMYAAVWHNVEEVTFFAL